MVKEAVCGVPFHDNLSHLSMQWNKEIIDVDKVSDIFLKYEAVSRMFLRSFLDWRLLTTVMSAAIVIFFEDFTSFIFVESKNITEQEGSKIARVAIVAIFLTT